MSPVTDFELVDQGFVNVVDDSVQRSDRVLRDLSEEDLVVVLAGRADSLARRAAADEVHSDTSELYVLTVGKDKFFAGVLALFLLARLLQLVGLLEVDEQVSRTGSFDPCIIDRFVLGVVKRILHNDEVQIKYWRL